MHSPSADPKGAARSSASSAELLAVLPGHLGPGSPNPQPVLDLPTLDAAIGAFIASSNDRPHRELGISPRDARVADDESARIARQPEELYCLLLTVPKGRSVGSLFESSKQVKNLGLDDVGAVDGNVVGAVVCGGKGSVRGGIDELLLCLSPVRSVWGAGGHGSFC